MRPAWIWALSALIALSLRSDLGVCIALLLPPFHAAYARSRAQRLQRPARDPFTSAAVAVDVLALSLAAGNAWHRAAQAAAQCCGADLAAGFRNAAARLELGAGASEVWEGDETLVEIGRVIARAERSGAAVGEVLHQLADEQRAEAGGRRLRAARQLETTLVVPVVCFFLPAAMVLTVVPLMVVTLEGMDLGQLM